METGFVNRAKKDKMAIPLFKGKRVKRERRKRDMGEINKEEEKKEEEKQFVNTENKGASVLLEEIDRNYTLVQGAELWCLQGNQVAYAFVSNQDGTKINGKQLNEIGRASCRERV